MKSDKIRNFSVRARSFDHLNDAYVIKESYTNDTSLMDIAPNQEFF